MSEQLPGKGRVHNLKNMDTFEQCPCCGAVWTQGHPASMRTLSVPEYAKAQGITKQAVTAKCRKGIIAAYFDTSGHWLIPVDPRGHK
jgi:hypothetical protein